MTPNPALISAPLSEAAWCHSPPCACPQIPSGMTLTLILTPNIGDLSCPARAEPHSPSSMGFFMPGRAAPVSKGSSSSYSPPKVFSLTEITTELPPVSLGEPKRSPLRGWGSP